MPQPHGTEEEVIGFKQSIDLLIKRQNTFQAELAKKTNSAARYELQTELEEIAKEIKGYRDKLSGLEDSDYSLLCRFNFQKETEYFESIVNTKKTFLQFIVRGHQENYGQRWLINKLIHHFEKKGKPIGKKIDIDFVANNIDTNLKFIQEIGKLLGISTGDLQTLEDIDIPIYTTLQNLLKQNTCVFILKNANSFIESNFIEFKAVFHKVQKMLKRINSTNQCIFFFVEETHTQTYSCTDHCIDYIAVDDLEAAELLDEFRLIDLYIHKAICEQTFKNWVKCCSMDFRADLLNNISTYIGDGNPQNIIPLIANKITNQDYHIHLEPKWLKH